MKDNNINVIHIPEVCEYNEFIARTIDIQRRNGINVLNTGICIDGKNSGTNNLLDVLKYKKDKERLIVHFHWPEKLYKNMEFEEFKKQINILKENGIKLVKTIHNLKPHEMVEENKLKDEYIHDNLDGILLFSKSQLESYMEANKKQSKIEVIPHPNYIKKDIAIVNKLNDSDIVLCVPRKNTSV